MGLSITIGIDVDTGSSEEQYYTVGSFNITHNVSPMWRKAGVYECLYKWHERKASEFIEPLSKGLADMLTNPDEYRKLNPSNGWGHYEGAKNFLKGVLDCCAEHTKCNIWIWA